jgi:hypothetical protein
LVERSSRSSSHNFRDLAWDGRYLDVFEVGSGRCQSVCVACVEVSSSVSEGVYSTDVCLAIIHFQFVSTIASVKMLFSKIFLGFLAPVAVLGAPVAPILDAVGDIIADNFIVVLSTQSQAGWLDFLNSRDAALVAATKDTYNIAGFQAFTGTFSGSLLDLVRSISQIKYIEPVTKVQASALTSQANAP